MTCILAWNFICSWSATFGRRRTYVCVLAHMHACVDGVSVYWRMDGSVDGGGCDVEAQWDVAAAVG